MRISDVSSDVCSSDLVSMFYDPMIAKLITWAPTRLEAIDKQIAALEQFEIEGPGHNIDFVSALMQHERFRSGNITPGFIAEIGRASCRERVCQYVYISVVAVSLQKKNKKKQSY